LNGGRILATGETQPFINSLYLQLFVMGNMEITRQKKINELVNENYVYASVLHYFGIKFYQYSEKTLEQVCQERGLNQQQLISNLESVGGKTSDHKLLLTAFPVDIIIEYLKHMHFIFIKQRMPYIADLISHADDNTPHQNVIKDLRFVFPLFVEDYIHHIYDEEDTLFSYTMLLHNALDGHYNPSQLYSAWEKHNIQEYAVAHDAHNDEMTGIRNITDNYKSKISDPLHIKVLYSELQSFEGELITHARVENVLLFPKALMLEQEVKQLVHDHVKLN